ncbi:hypothetical protein BVX98_05010 [bacterium F11]|nr:hypothetical protein BVX98_05010 [bacterium F11]
MPVFWDTKSFLQLRSEIQKKIQYTPSLLSYRFRFCVVDDSGQQDPEIATLHQKEDIQIVSVPYNMGHQGAIVYGLRHIKKEIQDKDLVVTMDSDGQDDPADVPHLLEPLLQAESPLRFVVLAKRTKRNESLSFKVLYFFFKLMFRLLTGTIMKTGNFAATTGETIKSLISHPFFDLCYSSTLLNLNIPIYFIECERAKRYEGQSRMNLFKLVMHGLRMMAPFSEKMTVRLLFFLSLTIIGFILFLLTILFVSFSSHFSLPNLTTVSFLLLLTLIGTALTLSLLMVVLFSQSHVLGLTGLSRQGPHQN